MNYCYRKGVQTSILCWEVVPFSEGLPGLKRLNSIETKTGESPDLLQLTQLRSALGSSIVYKLHPFNKSKLFTNCLRGCPLFTHWDQVPIAPAGHQNHRYTKP